MPDFDGAALLRILQSPRPDFSAADAEELAERAFGVRGRASALGGERDANFHLRAPEGDRLLKIANAAEPDELLDFQSAALEHIALRDPELPVPRVVRTLAGERWARCEGGDGSRFRVRMTSYLPGESLDRAPSDTRLFRDSGVFAARLDRALHGFFHRAADHPLCWDLKRAGRLAGLCEHIADPTRREYAERAFDRFQRDVEPELAGLRAQVIHNDISYHNATVDPAEPWRVAGVFDFGDLVHAPLVQELAVPVADIPFERPDPLARGAEIVAGYHSVTPLEPAEIAVIADLAIMRLALSLALAAWRPYAEERPQFENLREETWRMWQQLEEGRNGLEAMYRSACGLRPIRVAGGGEVPVSSSEALIERRRARLSPSLELSYDLPVHVVRGEGVWLYGPGGETWLDAYNNVPQVGHCHPRVVEAIARQVATLNANTRYLYESLVEYTERLTATMPPELDTCFMVSSGSEANDLAWRIAKTCTGNEGALVMERAYHGFTDALVPLSPEEDAGPTRRAAHVETLPPPDEYRGPWDRSVADRGERYAALADLALENLAAAGHAPAAVFVEPVFSSDGIIDPPAGYLDGVRARVHAAGGLFIADEVQAGFGRSGSHMWGFERGGVIPDIVTLGKPIGNGHPIGAVVVRRELAERFAAHAHFFSTTGGNPVSCVAGLAVLEVIERERLRENAARTGVELEKGLESLAQRHALIGDVRGAGLFLGVELVRERGTKEPAEAETRTVLNELRRIGVLVGRVGRYGNVLKIRPPIVFRSSHVERLLAALDRALDVASNG